MQWLRSIRRIRSTSSSLARVGLGTFTSLITSVCLWADDTIKHVCVCVASWGTVIPTEISGCFDPYGAS
jgi:hypothetical protein